MTLHSPVQNSQAKLGQIERRNLVGAQIQAISEDPDFEISLEALEFCAMHAFKRVCSYFPSEWTFFSQI